MDDVEVPEENLVGRPGEGFKIAMFALDQGRYTVAAGATGLIRACRDASAKYAKERKTFGVAIAEHQLVKEMIAQMESDYQAARLLWLRSGWLKNQGRRNTRETGLAKWFATVASERAAGDAVQVHGANGYSDEYPVGRFYRNCKGAVIYEGTREIHKLMQADYVLGFRAGQADALRAAGRSAPRRRLLPRSSDELRSLARVPPRRRAGGDRVRAHDGAGRRPQVRSGGGRGDAGVPRHACRSTAPSSSAKASATRRRCSTSARSLGLAASGRHAGFGLPAVDIAVDPLEGTNLCATGAPNAIAVLAASEQGGLLHAPDLYMEKLVVGPELEGRRQPRCAGRREPARDRPVPRARRRGSGRHRPRSPAARSASSTRSAPPARASG